MPDYKFVDMRTDDYLGSAVNGQKRIGIDTEFVREKTYFAQLCLVQISIGTDIFCADPLQTDTRNNARDRSLWEALVEPAWVLHSGRQDLEVVYQTVELMPRDIFDTQIAAALLGYQPQIGYGNLVQELFEVELAKTHTRADWSRRPLPEAYVEYAAEDVQFLLPAFDILAERLDRLGRLEWAVEDSRDLLDIALYQTDVDLAIERVKGARNLRGIARSAATALASWREVEAVRRDRPRQWILRDAVLLELAVKQPGSKAQLKSIPGLAERTAARAGEQLLDLLRQAAQRPSDYAPPQKPDERQKAMLKKMQDLVSNTASELGLASEIIAPRKELSAAMLGSRDLRLFRGWRQALIGQPLLDLLDSA